jgi:shikimate kinase
MEGTLWLIGMMGSGKSSVAPLVAGHLGSEWADTDELVEHLSGRRAGDLVAESEEEFRGHEADAIAAIAGVPVVVACGGGAVLREDNTATMRATGVVVWLRAEVPTLATRVGAGEGRPLLGADPTSALERLLEERAERYGAAAHAVVDTDGRTIEDVAMEVVAAWNASSGE